MYWRTQTKTVKDKYYTGEYKTYTHVMEKTKIYWGIQQNNGEDNHILGKTNMRRGIQVK